MKIEYILFVFVDDTFEFYCFVCAQVMIQYIQCIN